MKITQAINNAVSVADFRNPVPKRVPTARPTSKRLRVLAANAPTVNMRPTWSHVHNAVTKRKFIGIMKGIGISPLAIEISYIFQALFYGIVGSAVGLVLVFAFLKPYFDAYPINFPFSDGILVATYGSAFLRVAILLVVTLLAGYVPAKLIVRKNTLDSILGR